MIFRILLIPFLIFTFSTSALAADVSLSVDIGGDFTPPANVSNFTATAGIKRITLSWTNPADPDFAGVLIRRKTSGYPTGPADGVQVYNGTGTLYIDQPLTAGVRYYYTAFSYDGIPNYASGAVDSAVPLSSSAPTVPEKPTSPVRPEESTSPARPEESTSPARPEESVLVPQEYRRAEEKIKFSDFEFSVKLKDGFKKIPELQYYRFYCKEEVLISIEAGIFSKDISKILLTLDESSYLMRLNQNRYEAIIIMPENKGEYDLTINIVDIDNSLQTLKSIVFVEPYGYVFEKPCNLFQKVFLKDKCQERRINGAEIALYWFNQKSNSWEVWPAEKYNQENPQLTNQNGEYAFRLPKGKYYLLVKKSGYFDVQSEELEIKEGIINKNIELVAKKSFFGQIILIVIIFVLTGIGYWYYRRRLKFRSKK